MDFRGNSHQRETYPSFSLVVNRHILRRDARPFAGRLAWNNVASHQPHPEPVRPERSEDWAMTTFDRRNEEERRRKRRRRRGVVVILEPAIATDPLAFSVPLSAHIEPAPVQLVAVDDDRMTVASSLDLNAGETASAEGQPGRSKRFVKGVRMIFTCKSFLERHLRSLRKRQIRNA